MLIPRLLEWRTVASLLIALIFSAYSLQETVAEQNWKLEILGDSKIEVNVHELNETSTAETSANTDVGEAEACDKENCNKKTCEKEACDKEGCDGSACQAGECETDACDADACETEVCESSDSPETDVDAKDASTDQVASTHHQTVIIKIHVKDLPKTALKTFCLTSTGDILAACGNDKSGDVRHFSPTGEFIKSWELPFAPEAINVGSDGRIYAAGEGNLARFTLNGKVVNTGNHPFGEVTEERRKKLREQVIASHKKQREWMTDYLEDLDSQIEAIEKRLGIQKEEAAEQEEQADAEENDTPEATAKTEQVAQEDKADEMTGEIDDADMQAKKKQDLTPEEIVKRKRDELMLKSLASQRENYQRMVDQQGEAELTKEQVKKQVKNLLAYKMKVASISEADGEVFIATGASKGYGFSVWRMNRRFEAGEQIVDNLSGCCGQMDVQACDSGIYVAENSRHKVRCFDRKGKEVCSWGSAAREGLTGFGSCCNPMNVAFGPERSVYTAESGTGRIKQYSPEGKLLGLVGKADLVPGCKKVSIAVGPAGDRVYMLDITRNHLLMLERNTDKEQVAYYEKDLSKGYPKPEGAYASFFRTMGKALVGKD